MSIEKNKHDVSNSVISIITDTFHTGIEEMKKTMGGFMGSGKNGEKGQITPNLESREANMIEKRKHIKNEN